MLDSLWSFDRFQLPLIPRLLATTVPWAEDCDSFLATGKHTSPVDGVVGGAAGALERPDPVAGYGAELPGNVAGVGVVPWHTADLAMKVHRGWRSPEVGERWQHRPRARSFEPVDWKKPNIFYLNLVLGALQSSGWNLLKSSSDQQCQSILSRCV